MTANPGQILGRGGGCCQIKTEEVTQGFLFPGGSDGKETAYDVEDPGSIPGSGRSPSEGNDNPLSILAWRISWTEEPDWLQFMRSQRVGHN